MRFALVHKLTTYLMVLAAVAALLLSPEMGWATVGIALLGIVASWFAEPGRMNVQRYTALWNIATVLVLIYLVVDAVRGGPVLISGARFLLFVLINKLFNRRTSKDYQQIYVISFLVLVVATTVNTSISYALCFTLFVIFTTWGMCLLHLRREMEDNYLLKHSSGAQSEKVEVERILNSRRIVGGRFLAGTSLVSVGVLLIAVMIFTLFPRIGFGLFLGLRRGGVPVAGFSERVQLGQHGVIRDNPQVVMRVLFPRGRPRHPLRWRGSAFDYYEDGVWSHAADLIGRTRSARRVNGMYMMNHAPGLSPRPAPRWLRRHLLRQDVYLEPIDSSVIFGADRPVGLEVPRPAAGGRPFFLPRRGPLGEIRAAQRRSAGVRYTVFSHIHRPGPARLRRSGSITDPRWERFLQLPDSLPARVRQLARRITRDQPTLFDKVQAVQRYLRGRYRYTLDLKHDPRLDPVDEFLFVTRRGHCEYFASAMALLLRSVGIHSRNVNGFAGGEWNSVGNYLAVRQGDAHAWVEVLFSGVGWVTFDPTPSGRASPAAGSSWTRRLRQAWDSLRMRWFRYVVEYDLGKQVTLLKGLGKLVSPPKSTQSRPLTSHWRSLLAGGGALLLVALVVYLRRRRASGPTARQLQQRRTPAAGRLYLRALRVLARRGYVKQPQLTPQEFAHSLLQSDCPTALAQQMHHLTQQYYAVRFSGEQGGVEQLDRLRQGVLELRRVP